MASRSDRKLFWCWSSTPITAARLRHSSRGTTSSNHGRAAAGHHTSHHQEGRNASFFTETKTCWKDSSIRANNGATSSQLCAATGVWLRHLLERLLNCCLRCCTWLCRATCMRATCPSLRQQSKQQQLTFTNQQHLKVSVCSRRWIELSLAQHSWQERVD